MVTSQSFKAPKIPKLNKKIVSSSVLSSAPKLKVTKINAPISTLSRPVNQGIGKVEGDDAKESIIAQESLIRVVNSLNKTSAVLNQLTDYLITETQLEQELLRDKIRGEKLEDERERKKIKESKLEGVGKKARDAFLKPVKAIGNKAKGIFDTLKNVLGLLFVGWLGNKGFDAIELSAEGNIKALEDLRNEVVTGLGIALGTFTLLNAGILGLVPTILGLSLSILALPFKALFDAGRGILNKIRGGGGGKPGGGNRTGGTRTRGGGRSMRGGPDIRNPLRNKPTITGDAKPGIFGSIKNAAGAGFNFVKDGLKNLLLKKVGSGRPGVKILKAIKVLSNSPFGKFAAAGGRKIVDIFRFGKNLLDPKNLKKVGDALGKAKVLTKVLGPLFALIDIQSRANKGMSPAQAIIPALLKAVMMSGGAVIGGSIPFLGPFTPFAGSWAGGWLGDQLMNGIDGIWDKSWDDKFFKGFNEFTMGIGKSDPTGMISKIFPYEGADKKYGDSTTIAKGKDSSDSSVSSMDSPPVSAPPMPSMAPPSSAPSPQPIIIRRRSGGQQQVPLKVGSATKVPNISSSNPDNFLTLYSQAQYNVVG